MKGVRYLAFLSKELIEAVWQLIKAVLLSLVDLYNFFKNRKKEV